VTPVTTFAGMTVALFGLGGSGLASALALQAGGAIVVACDDDPAKIAQARAKGIATADLRGADWSRFAAMILSPGVPLTHPEPHWSARLAQHAGVEIIGDIELFCRERDRIAPDAPFVAITGTNGKSTTTALIAHILREAGLDVAMGGNIGTAILSLPPPAQDRVHVIEMSSFQIDLTPSLRPSVGVLLNVSPDHLDRHGTIERYAAIKESLVAPADFAVVGIDDPLSRAIAERHVGAPNALRTVAVRPDDRLAPDADFVAAGGKIYEWIRDFELAGARETRERAPREVADLKGVKSLRGAHNAQNAAAAAAAAVRLGLDRGAIAGGMRSFPGLPHRMEEIGRRRGAIFVNDSKATNADSTEKALASFDHIFWILGGKAKEGGIAPLRRYFPKIEKAYLIGAATEDFAKMLEGQVRFERCGSLDRAVAQAAADVLESNAAEPVVLLSPACASYDQYPNFEVRGDHFRRLVRALPGIELEDAEGDRHALAR
jgi:UDP-N-acetylmuramoylalanine--D-glutamate ligase